MTKVKGFTANFGNISVCAIITKKTELEIFIMDLRDLRLRPEEKAALNLRKLYETRGYSFYRMSRFEEYDFYADKKDFLTSQNILTFTDINGKLMALRPDVTLSIIKHIKNSEDIQKFYYDEKVYRVPKNANSFREISQAGVECVGNLNEENLSEVLELAVLSLRKIAENKRCVLDVSHAGLIADLIKNNKNRHEILKCIAEKNIHELKKLNASEKIINLVGAEEKEKSENALRLFDLKSSEIIASLKKNYPEIRIDFSVINNLNYYNGIVFRGFIEGIPESILSGGQYDGLMSMMGHEKSKAVGFAVYLDLID